MSAGTPPLVRPARLPGDPDRRTALHRVIRVDQAGEYGAARIYAGQIAVLGKGRHGAVLRHMAAQERVHLDEFDRQIRRRHVRPTLLQPVWHVAGFALGAVTALLGERAAMACTVAVEEVIDGHYAHQAESLGDDEPALKATIARFRAEESEHRDIGLANGAELATGYPLLSALVKAGSRAAIWLSQRV
ncbi:demethoxyubiquinone hydroxylase family protein [Oleisolibacter albus]|uniref:demethoxyubiquinone hydroxylase family protein n=1 Tax=Oleisolibacter albus TaxID=2171757 RepID=UPI000DF148F6|nr:demethoxyubiquinone hydroxylase family protein [Oleisolibacter albus]